MKYNKKEFNDKEYWKDGCNGFCNCCGNPIEEPENSQCDGCEQEWEERDNEQEII